MKDVSVVDAANLLIASGAFVMVIGFIGCCGALKQIRPLLVVVSLSFMMMPCYHWSQFLTALTEYYLVYQLLPNFTFVKYVKQDKIAL